jgi:uncharacterized protein with PIN domain
MFQGIGFGYPKARRQIEPAFCDTCGVVIGKDITKKFSKCPKCRKKLDFYNDHAEMKEDDWGLVPVEDYLVSKKYWHCPGCKEEKLTFEFMGCWD